MDNMERLKAEAQEWISGQGGNYDLTVKDEALELLFKPRKLSFTIHCPSVSENENFSVWTECTQLQSYLEPLLAFCESKKSVTEILNKVHTVINKILEKEVDEGEDEEEEDDEVDDDYYDACNDDFGEEPAEGAKPAAANDESSEEDDDAETFFGAGCSPTAILRLKRDLKVMKTEAHKFGIEGNPRGNNLFLWDVKLTGFETGTKLGKDLKLFAEKCNKEPVVYLEMQFPGDFPMSPPFVRVTKPRFKFLTGHVTIGGSICMEMLTKSGWTPTNDIESILVQIRSEIMSDPNARLDTDPGREYTEREARDAFNRMVDRYGWNK